MSMLPIFSSQPPSSGCYSLNIEDNICSKNYSNIFIINSPYYIKYGILY